MKGGGGEEQEIPGVRVGGREKYYLVFYMDSRARPGKEGCCLLGMHGQIHPSRYTSSCWEINCSFPWDLSEPVQHLLFLHQTHIHLPTFLRGSITCRGAGGVCLPGRLCISRLRLVFLKQRVMEVGCGCSQDPASSLPFALHVPYQSTVPLVKGVSAGKHQSLLQLHGAHGCCSALCSC